MVRIPASMKLRKLFVVFFFSLSHSDRFHTQNIMNRYTCRKCGTVLCTSAQRLEHESSGETLPFGHHKSRKLGAPNSAVGECTAVFLNSDSDLQWIGDTTSAEGKIQCPKCSARVGSFAWAGMQCSCGAWVAPAFQLVLSKIDCKPQS
jgi:dual specificity phosphatase 12